MPASAGMEVNLNNENDKKIVKLIISIIIGIFILSFLFVILNSMNTGNRVNYSGNYNGWSMNYNSGFSASSFLVFIIKLILVIFSLGLFIGIFVLIKNNINLKDDNDMFDKTLNSGQNKNIEFIIDKSQTDNSGQDLDNEFVTCGNCGNEIEKEWKTCPYCGEYLKI